MSDEQRPEGFYWVRANVKTHGNPLPGWGQALVVDGEVIEIVLLRCPYHLRSCLEVSQWGPRIPSPDESTVHVTPPHTVRVDVALGCMASE